MYDYGRCRPDPRRTESRWNISDDDEVLAVCVRPDLRTDEYHFVAVDRDELETQLPEDDWPCDQCSNCGWSGYTLTSNRVTCNECGMGYPIEYKLAGKVMFP